MLFKKLLNFKNRKIWVFQNINFSYFKKVESEKCHIFFLGIRYMLLANKRTQKTAKNMHVAYFLSLNLFCKKNIKAKKSSKSRIKIVTQCNYRNKKLINLKEILHRNL